MNTEDLKGLGFRCGVEIHQQLLTSKKLFCRCPAGKYSNEHHAEVLRHMRPTLSEMGVYDPCALMEFKTKKEILYRLNKESVCTYDMDDTPPFPINQEALDIAIELALLCGCRIVDEMHISRKQYLDGSIPTGFQRTGIIGINGSIPFEGKIIPVVQMSIEEDSCREVSDVGHRITFRTDRLGMPLIEVVTSPCFESPDEAARGVNHIGRLLRATGKVRRGLGAVRQDVNVSITGGKRVEIKGVPRFQHIPKLTYYEALRQKALLEIRDELLKRGLNPSGLKTVERDLTEELKNTESPILSDAIKRGHHIRGIKLAGFTGILNMPILPGKMFAFELSGRVRVIACLDSRPNLYYTENYPDYFRSHVDLRSIRIALGVGKEDIGIIVWGPEADTKTGTDEIKNRIIDAFDGVPNETREHLMDGISDFERILPGADRMYPDTDHPPVRITRERVKNIAKSLPEATYKVEGRFKKYGIPEDAIADLSLSKLIPVIDELASEKCNMNLVGRILGQTRRSLLRQGKDLSQIPPQKWKEIVLICRDLSTKAMHFEEIVLKVASNSEVSVTEMAEAVARRS